MKPLAPVINGDIRQPATVTHAALAAEMALLGSFLLDKKQVADLRAGLAVDDFYDPRHQEIYKTILQATDEGKPIDLVMLPDELKRRDMLEAVGGSNYLLELAEGVPHAVNAPHYAKIVREHSECRKVLNELATAHSAISQNQSIEHALVPLKNYQARRESKIMSMSTLGQAFPTQNEPLVDGLIRQGEVATFVGGSKSRKSWLLMHLCMSIAAGLPWLGFQTTPRKVLLVDLELSGGTLSFRSSKVMAAMGINIHNLGNLDIMPMRGETFDIGKLESLAAQWAGRYDFIAIDPLFRCYEEGSDENSNAYLASLYTRFARVAANTGAALGIVHHTTKGSQEGKRAIDLGSGAGSIGRATDCLLALRPVEGQDNAATLECVLRSFAPVEAVNLAWSDYAWRTCDAPMAESMTPELFAGLVGDEPRGRQTLIGLAVETGATQRQAGAMFSRALEAGLLVEVKIGRRLVYKRPDICARTIGEDSASAYRNPKGNSKTASGRELMLHADMSEQTEAY